MTTPSLRSRVALMSNFSSTQFLKVKFDDASLANMPSVGRGSGIGLSRGWIGTTYQEERVNFTISIFSLEESLKVHWNIHWSLRKSALNAIARCSSKLMNLDLWEDWLFIRWKIWEIYLTHYVKCHGGAMGWRCCHVRGGAFRIWCSRSGSPIAFSYPCFLLYTFWPHWVLITTPVVPPCIRWSWEHSSLLEKWKESIDPHSRDAWREEIEERPLS